MTISAADLRWWQCCAIYEIAPISFQDSNGDGKGDLEGLLSRIDYLKWLGIGAVWLTPIYPSPMLDFGYDISDFGDVDPSLGSLNVLDRLIEALHKAGIRLILDYVPNHTSNQHPWFLESRASRTASKRDWYIWADLGPDGGPPNNWLSRFGNSAWTWDDASGQYYYHSFLSEQPDLNWRSEAVRGAMAEVLRFWMKRGVDGFRVDASAVLSKDALLRNNPPNREADESTPPPQRLRPVFTDDRPEAMTYLGYLRSIIEEFDDRLLCGEVQGKTDRIGHFYGKETPRLHLPLNFALLDSEWTAVSLQAEIDAYMNAIPEEAWPNWVIGGHDKKRIASKVGEAQARILAMLLLTLRGTPIFFAGDEIGLEQVPIPSDRVVDPFEKLVPGYDLNRDPQRAPMRWSSGPNAGFTAGDPWLPIGPHAETQNVSTLQQDRRSLLWLYKKLIEIRNHEPALVAGEYVPKQSRNDILLYGRAIADRHIMVALNIAHQPRRLTLEDRRNVLLSTHMDDRHGTEVSGSVLLRGDEGVLLAAR